VHAKILDLDALIPRLAGHRQRLDRIIVAAGDFDSLRGVLSAGVHELV